MEADPSAAFAKRREDLAEISTDLAEIDNLPLEKLTQAQTTLAAGRTAVADALLAEIEQEAEDGIERAAQAAYLRGEIAEEDIRWADAAAHYTRAANLAPNYDRLKKAHEFIWRAGDYAGAVASGEALIQTAIAEFGEGLEKHAAALNHHALTLEDMGRYEEAEPLYRQAIEIDKATIGEAHPEYAKSLNNLALFLQGRGRFEEVPGLYRDAVRIARAALGDEHPDVRAHYAYNYADYLREHDPASPDLADLIAAFGDDIGR